MPPFPLNVSRFYRFHWAKTTKNWHSSDIFTQKYRLYWFGILKAPPELRYAMPQGQKTHKTMNLHALPLPLAVGDVMMAGIVLITTPMR
ncbi:hypothetical protein KOSB73_220239 [Klebsiella grimontii]|uniref:Uncharacterized protein n=1 Tax=Klebsiella grimontii TaxID=2058152 RepID=A0A285AZM8_9ENTR|nr:hypothetical protein KOSB73_220239 [Klebsiella grimontii]